MTTPVRSYRLGTAVEVTAKFKTSAGAAAEPSTVTFKVYDEADQLWQTYAHPDAAIAHTNGSNEYVLTFTPDAAGDWTITAASTGAGVTVTEEVTVTILAVP